MHLTGKSYLLTVENDQLKYTNIPTDEGPFPESVSTCRISASTRPWEIGKLTVFGKCVIGIINSCGKAVLTYDREKEEYVATGC